MFYWHHAQTHRMIDLPCLKKRKKVMRKPVSRKPAPVHEQGDAYAQHNLGNCYLNGDGLRQDKEEAVKWWRKAAEQGLADAQNNMSLL